MAQFPLLFCCLSSVVSMVTWGWVLGGGYDRKKGDYSIFTQAWLK